MGLTPLKRAVLSGGLLMTYKIHNLPPPPPPTPELNWANPTTHGHTYF